MKRAIVAVTLALAGWRLTSCDAPTRASVPAIAEGRDRYTVAWVRETGEGGALDVQQFVRGSLEPLGPPATVEVDAHLVAARLELVPVGDRYLAFGQRFVDPDEEPAVKHLFMKPLDSNGQPLGEATWILANRMCHGAGVVGTNVMIATEIDAGRWQPRGELGVLVFDAGGNRLASWRLANRPEGCASAAHGGELATAWIDRPDEALEEHAYRLRVAIGNARGNRGTFEVPVEDVDAGRVRVASHGDHWAILYADRARRLHVVVVDSQGAVQRRHDLPDAIDRDTVDLASNERGVFITWTDDHRVHFLGLDGTAHAAKTRARGGDAPRALGSGTRCLAAWVEDAERAGVVAVSDCP
jgi:hypothetical protein